MAARRLWGDSAWTLSQQLRQFSQDITGVVELDELVDVTMRTLSHILRVRRGGSSGGHKGIASLGQRQDFWRLKIGVANQDRPHTEARDFVLQR